MRQSLQRRSICPGYCRSEREKIGGGLLEKAKVDLQVVYASIESVTLCEKDNESLIAKIRVVKKVLQELIKEMVDAKKVCLKDVELDKIIKCQ